jgi:Cu/Ag efflux protein CusF
MKHWILAGVLICTAPAWAAADWTQGSIVKVEPDKARVTLKHQRIKRIGMEAMTMPFKVTDGVVLAPFKVGDRVRFTVVEQDDHLMVDALEKLK